jgi:hypothetical protein
MLLADAAASGAGAFHSRCLFQDIDSAQHLLLKGIIIGGGGYKPQPFLVYAILYGVCYLLQMSIIMSFPHIADYFTKSLWIVTRKKQLQDKMLYLFFHIIKNPYPEFLFPIASNPLHLQP